MMGGPYGGAPGLMGGNVELNHDGLPIRPGKDQCLLYLNNGTCPNGIDCIFDHPNKPKAAGDDNKKGEWQDWNKDGNSGGWQDWSKKDWSNDDSAKTDQGGAPAADVVPDTPGPDGAN